MTKRTFRQTLKEGLLQVARIPAVTAGLDALTLRRGASVSCAGRWPLQVTWRRRLELNFRTWERDFVRSYLSNITPSDVVYDVGTEHGEWAALAATRVGGDRVHMFEPNAAAWREIRKIWELNRLGGPGGCWAGFVADVPTVPSPPRPRAGGWPDVTGSATEPVKFESLLDRKRQTVTTIDEYAAATNCPPDVIKLDIEGAEVVAVRGAGRTLAQRRPMVFLSYHPWLVGGYGAVGNEVFDAFESAGYERRLLARDHEEHWVLWHPDARRPVVPAEP